VHPSGTPGIRIPEKNIDKKITEYVDKVKKSGSDRLEYLAEIEILRREKEKLSHYIYNRGTLKNS